MQESRYLPLYLDASRLRVLVVGGGEVGARRALMFRKAGSKVTVIAREFSRELLEAEGVRLIKAGVEELGELLEAEVESHDLIVVALPSRGEASRIALKALEMGKLVNNAVSPGEGNVIVPFRGEASGVKIAVTSLGKSGHAARLALEKCVKAIESTREVESLLRAMSKLKETLKGSVPDPEVRISIYDRVYGDREFRELVRKGMWLEAYERALEIARGLYKGL